MEINNDSDSCYECGGHKAVLVAMGLPPMEGWEGRALLCPDCLRAALKLAEDAVKLQEEQKQ